MSKEPLVAGFEGDILNSNFNKAHSVSAPDRHAHFMKQILSQILSG